MHTSWLRATTHEARTLSAVKREPKSESSMSGEKLLKLLSWCCPLLKWAEYLQAKVDKDETVFLDQGTT